MKARTEQHAEVLPVSSTSSLPKYSDAKEEADTTPTIFDSADLFVPLLIIFIGVGLWDDAKMPR